MQCESFSPLPQPPYHPQGGRVGISASNSSKLTERLDTLSEGAIPAAVKYFAFPFRCVHYAEELGQDFTVNGMHPKSTPLGDARKLSYMTYLAQTYKLDREVERPRQYISLNSAVHWRGVNSEFRIATKWH